MKCLEIKNAETISKKICDWNSYERRQELERKLEAIYQNDPDINARRLSIAADCDWRTANKFLKKKPPASKPLSLRSQVIKFCKENDIYEPLAVAARLEVSRKYVWQILVDEGLLQRGYLKEHKKEVLRDKLEKIYSADPGIGVSRLTHKAKCRQETARHFLEEKRGVSEKVLKKEKILKLCMDENTNDTRLIADRLGISIGYVWKSLIHAGLLRKGALKEHRWTKLQEDIIRFSKNAKINEPKMIAAWLGTSSTHVRKTLINAGLLPKRVIQSQKGLKSQEGLEKGKYVPGNEKVCVDPDAVKIGYYALCLCVIKQNWTQERATNYLETGKKWSRRVPSDFKRKRRRENRISQQMQKRSLAWRLRNLVNDEAGLDIGEKVILFKKLLHDFGIFGLKSFKVYRKNAT